MIEKYHKILLKILVVLTFGLICLGAATRAMNAGLACPDWPLCFGQIIPDYHPQVYFEFIHRALAGSVSIFALVLGVWLLRQPTTPKVIRSLIWFVYVLLIAQIVMGGLTVLKLLNSGIVTTHLAMGTAVFGCLLWISMHQSQTSESVKPVSPSLFRILVLGVAAVYGQILLGGWVASNYAGLACVEFPLCKGSWIPSLQGVIGIQVIHRLGAYTLFAILFAIYQVMRKHKNELHPQAVRIGRWILSLLLAQIAVGAANVLFLTPALLSVLHTAIAILLLASMLRIVFISRA